MNFNKEALKSIQNELIQPCTNLEPGDIGHHVGKESVRGDVKRHAQTLYKVKYQDQSHLSTQLLPHKPYRRSAGRAGTTTLRRQHRIGRECGTEAEPFDSDLK